MKKNILILLGIVISLVIGQAQNDVMYFMKGGAVIEQISVLPADLDSIIFYNPESTENKFTATYIWSESSLGQGMIIWDPEGTAPKVGDLPRFSKDYNWQVVGYYDDEEYTSILDDLTVELIDEQVVYVKVLPMTDVWDFTGNMLNNPKGDGVTNRDVLATQRFRYVGLHIPPMIGTQPITKLNKRFLFIGIDWDGDNQTGAYTDHVRYIHIPNSITEIGDEAFMTSNSLMKIEFEQGNNIVTFMEDKNFHSMTFGVNMSATDPQPWNIPGPNDPQWARTFLGNELCHTYILPKYYNAIVEEMFRWTDPDTIVVPSCVNVISHRAFLDDDAGGGPTKQGFFDNASVRVKVLKLEGTTPPALRRGRPTEPNPGLAADDVGSAWHILPFGTRVKRNGVILPDPIKIIVPMSAVDTYKAAPVWNLFTDYIAGY